jgi:hypothetical protein
MNVGFMLSCRSSDGARVSRLEIICKANVEHAYLLMKCAVDRVQYSFVPLTA